MIAINVIHHLVLLVLAGWRHFMRWLQRIIDGHARACGRGVLPRAGILAGDVGGASMPHSNALSQQRAQGRKARAFIDLFSAGPKLFNPPGTDARASPVVSIYHFALRVVPTWHCATGCRSPGQQVTA